MALIVSILLSACSGEQSADPGFDPGNSGIAPVATAVSPAAFNEDIQSVITLSYTDVENDLATVCTLSNLSNVTVTQACACAAGACSVGVTGISNYNGTASFDSTVTANGQLSNLVTTSFIINAVDDVPVASTISPTAFNEEIQSVITLSYSDVDSDQATACSVSNLANVTVTQACVCVAGTCSVGVTGDSNYFGAASFNYSVIANSQTSNTATASLTINNINDMSFAAAISPVAFNEDMQSVVTLSYVDVDGDLASACVLSGLVNITETRACACAAGICTVGVTGINNYNGAGSFNYAVITNGQTSNTAAASLTIMALDDAPVAVAITPGAFNEDTQAVITLSYTDIESDQASACAVSNLANVTVTQACACTAGTCTVGVTGTSDYNGAASFNYAVISNSQTSNAATASLTINNVDDAPVASTISPAAFNEDTQSVITLSYSDLESDQASSCTISGLSNVSVTQACACTAGTCTVGITGSSSYNGAASFNYTVTANSQTSNTVAASFTINAVDDAPVANAISPASFNEDVQSVITLSYTDAESDQASACAVSNLTNVMVTQACACVAGTCTIGVTGTSDYNGAASFDYTVTANSQTSSTATASFTINTVDDVPVATAITPATFKEDTQSVITLNYTDGDGDLASACTPSNLSNVTVTQACACTAGVCTVGVTGTLNYAGAASFDYTVTANGQTSNTVAATFTISAVGDVPIAAAISPVAFNEDTQSIITLSYSDGDGDLATTCALSSLNNVTVTQACACVAGTCTVGVTGTSNYNGAASFNYTVTAGGDTSAAAVASLTINNVDDAPVTSAISPAGFNEDTQSVITLSYTDADSDQASACGLSSLNNVTVTQACACASGTCTVGVTGTSNYTGAASFNYTVTANSQSSNTATASLTINNVNDAPVANAISPAGFNEDTQSIITLSYSDIDGDLAGSCTLSGLTNITETQACACAAGTCTVGVTGTSNYAGAASFNYTVTANSQTSNSATATLSITGVDDAPVANAISPAAFNEDTQSVITLSYTDADNDQASACGLSSLNNVTVTQACACASGTCTVGVTSTSNYFGAASFDYAVTANSQSSNTATASLTINNVNDAPVAAAITPAAFNEDTQSVITLSYTDLESDQASSCSVSGLTNVTATQACACASGTCTVGVTGTNNYAGAASFNYTVTANSQTSNSATGTLTINNLDDPPVANAITPAAFNEDTQSVITLSYSDLDGDQATACGLSGLTNVTVTQACACVAGTCSVGVTGTVDYVGAASFNYTVVANSQTSNAATANLTINGVNDPPVANAITPAAFNEDTQSVTTLSYTDADGDQATACTPSNLTNVAVTQACACAAGTCTVGVTGTNNYNGAASFDYTVTANLQISNTVTATLTINAVDDAPVAAAIIPAAFNEDAQSVITLNYADAEGDQATACTPSNLTNVTVTQACACAAGICTVGVTGTANYFGAASFDYTVTANGQTSNTVTATLSITRLADDAFTMTLPFTNSANYTFDSALIDVTGGVARLAVTDQTDDDNNITTGFAAGTHNGTAWDGNNLVLGNSTCDATSTNCSALDASWTPQWGSLIAYYQLDGAVGTIGNAATITGTVGGDAATNGANLDYVTARLSQGIDFNGTSNMVVLPAGITISSNSAVTIMFWNFVTTAVQSTAFTIGNSSDCQAHVPWSTGNVIWDYGGTRLQTSYSNHLGKWTHVTLTSDGSGGGNSMRIYLNSELQLTSAASGPGSNLSGGFIGGKTFGTDRFHNGRIDDFAAWTTHLTQAEIQKIYNRQRAKYAGSFTSRVMDVGAGLGAGATWTGFNWIPTLPFSKELPDAGANETTANYASLTNSTLMNNIAGLWHLNGNGTDDSGNGNNGTVTGATTSDLAALGNRSYDFDGTNDYVDLGDPAALEIGGAMSISAWIKTTQSSGEREIVSRWDQPNNQKSYRLYMTAAGLTLFRISSDGTTNNVTATGTTAINDGHWHHVLGVYDSTNAIIYVDGVAENSPTYNGVVFSGTNENTYIGAFAEGTFGNGFIGLIDEVAIWSRGLNANEARQLYQRGANRVKYQVRSCNDNACAGETWDGPDGAIDTYFSEQHNNSSIDADNDGSNEPDGNVQTGLPSLTFNNFTLNGGGGQLAMTNNRYFQYRAILESEDENTLCSAATCSPELTSITINPIHYNASQPNVVNKAALAQAYLTLTSFTQTGVTCASGIQYQLSPDSGTNWYYYDTGANPGPAGWKQENTNNFTLTNTAAEMNANAATFDDDVSAGTLWVKAFLNSNGAQTCQIDRLDVGGTQ